MATRMRIFCWVLLAIVLPSRSAARSKHSKNQLVPQTVYDQKQTGDYNVQLHLKDFQIIALLGEDSIGALGDYDYNYDYSDFTVKPGTHKPTSESTPSSTPPPPSTPIPNRPSSPSSTSKPINHPYPIISPSPNATQLPKEKPHQLANALNEVDKTEKPATSSSSAVTGEVELVPSSTTTTRRNDNIEEPNSPGKIKVQIIETPVNVVPGEEVQNGAKLGDIVQMRRCVTGFARDKRGRCRRVRRPVTGAPQLPYGFGRLASTLVSRFRHASPDTSSISSSSESAED